MRLSKDKLDIIKAYLKNKPVLKAYLFGSQANGNAEATSDIDILVELDYSQKIGFLFLKMQIEF